LKYLLKLVIVGQVHVAPVHALSGQVEGLLPDILDLSITLNIAWLLIDIITQSGLFIPILMLLDEIFPIS